MMKIVMMMMTMMTTTATMMAVVTMTVLMIIIIIEREEMFITATALVGFCSNFRICSAQKQSSVINMIKIKNNLYAVFFKSMFSILI